VSLIDTYKHINTVYYEEREARRAARAKGKAKSSTTAGGSGVPPPGAPGTGTHNHGWDDENYDYIVTSGELFYGRYTIKERIGKGSFGQVVRAEDMESGKDVAIKIIKSKKPFLIQAKTEIELLTHLNEKDNEDQHNIGKLSWRDVLVLVLIDLFSPINAVRDFPHCPWNYSSTVDSFHVSKPSVSCFRNVVFKSLRTFEEHPVWWCFPQPDTKVCEASFESASILSQKRRRHYSLRFET